MPCAAERKLRSEAGAAFGVWKTHRIAGKHVVRLEAHFPGLRDRRIDLCAIRVVHAGRDTYPFEQDFKEELRIECEGRRVEGDLRVPRHERIRSRDCVRCEKVDDFRRGEVAAILHAGQDRVCVLLWEGDSFVLCCVGRLRTSGEELESGCSRTVRAASEKASQWEPLRTS